jgi:uncharacterized protein
MRNYKQQYYPTTLEAIHLLVLYLVLQSFIDFPLAMFDYQKDTNLLSNIWISFISNLCITAFIFYFGYKKAQTNFSNTFALKRFNPLLIFSIIIILPALQYQIGFVSTAVEKILPAPTWFWELFGQIFKNRFGFWGALFKVSILAPIVEESLFRGIIMHGFMRNYKNWYSILISAMMFSIYHLNPWQMPYTFFLGLLLGWLMVRSKSLIVCIIAHSLNNLIVLLSITYQNQLNESWIAKFSTVEYLLMSSIALAFGGISIYYITKKTNTETSESTTI